MTAEAFAPAKINLTLHVTGQRGDGYHLLDSLVVFADVGDRVSVCPAVDWSLSLLGPMAPGLPRGDANLVLRSARAMGGAPCAITLDKRLPVAAGLGGGSSDAAAVLRALHRLDGRAVPENLLALGADVPVCMAPRPRRMSGIGEVLADVPPLPPLFAVLANAGVAVETPAVFAALMQRQNAPMPPDLPEWRDTEALVSWLGAMRNDLELPARLIAPAIGVTLARLGALAGARLARMSGSGATCYALFTTMTEAEEGARALRLAHPDWWIAASGLGAQPD